MSNLTIRIRNIAVDQETALLELLAEAGLSYAVTRS